jgi:DNA-binding CsgD family transcriptional regulator
MNETEKELVMQQRIALHHIEQYVKANQLDQIGEFFPGFLHFNRKDDLHIKYMNPTGLEKFDVPLEYIQKNGAEFFDRFVHRQSVQEIFPRFIDFYNRNDSGRTYADCQDLLSPFNNEYYQILTVTKVVKELDGLMSMSLPVHELGPNLIKIKGLVKIDTFYEKNFERFQLLTNREKEILRLVALGNTNKHISEALNISAHTVRTHRNHIWQKLSITHLKDALHIAEVFGLID